MSQAKSDGGLQDGPVEEVLLMNSGWRLFLSSEMGGQGRCKVQGASSLKGILVLIVQG